MTEISATTFSVETLVTETLLLSKIQIQISKCLPDAAPLTMHLSIRVQPVTMVSLQVDPFLN